MKPSSKRKKGRETAKTQIRPRPNQGAQGRLSTKATVAKTKELNLDLPNRNPVNRLDHRPRSQGRPRCRARSPEAKARQAAAQRPGTASKGPRAATKRGSGATDAARVYGTRANAVFSPGQTNVAWLRRLQTPKTWVLPVQDTFLASSMLLHMSIEQLLEMQ